MITKIINSILLPFMSGMMQRSEPKVPKNDSGTETIKKVLSQPVAKQDIPNNAETAAKRFVIADDRELGRIELLQSGMATTESQPFKTVQFASMSGEVTGFEKVFPPQRTIVREGTWKAVQVVDLTHSPQPTAPSASPAKGTAPAKVKHTLSPLSQRLCGRWGVVEGSGPTVLACFESREKARKYMKSLPSEMGCYYMLDRHRKGPNVKITTSIPGHLQWLKVGNSPMKYAVDVDNLLVFTAVSSAPPGEYRVGRINDVAYIKEKAENNPDTWPTITDLVEHWYYVEQLEREDRLPISPLAQQG